MKQTSQFLLEELPTKGYEFLEAKKLVLLFERVNALHLEGKNNHVATKNLFSLLGGSPGFLAN